MTEEIYSQELYEMCKAHFNEPVLTDFGLGRCIGYGEDEADCYIIIQMKREKLIWQTCVGGYYWLDRLKGQSYVKSTQGEDWDDFFRLDSSLELNGAPKQPEFKLELRHEEVPEFNLGA
jgi:hypothetical protein